MRSLVYKKEKYFPPSSTFTPVLSYQQDEAALSLESSLSSRSPPLLPSRARLSFAEVIESSIAEQQKEKAGESRDDTMAYPRHPLSLCLTEKTPTSRKSTPRLDAETPLVAYRAVRGFFPLYRASSRGPRPTETAIPSPCFRFVLLEAAKRNGEHVSGTRSRARTRGTG